MSTDYGHRLRTKRMLLHETSASYSLRRVAQQVGVTPSFLSKVERGDLPPPSEETIKKIAELLGENPDVMLAMAGKISSDLKEVILKRPQLVADLIRQVKNAPDNAVLRIVREVRDGNW